MIDLSKLDASRTEEVAKYCAYQPFQLPGGITTGAGLSWRKTTTQRSSRVGDPLHDEFLTAVQDQARFYEDLLTFTDKTIGFAGRSVLDYACNAGYFAFRASQLGASRVLGVDTLDYTPFFASANGALGTSATFKKDRYDSTTGKVGGVEGKFDIVLSIAFMLHLSEPARFLAALSQHAAKAVLLCSRFPASDDYVIRYHKNVRKYFKDASFPLCFDSDTMMTDSLLRFGLTDLGFSKIVEVPRQTYWPLSSDLRTFLAIRS